MRKFTRWDEVYSTEDTTYVALEIASRLAADFSSAAGCGHIIEAITARDYRALALMDCQDMGNAHDDYLQRQILALFSKRQDVVLPNVDRRQVSLDSFLMSEVRCAETNRIFRLRASGSFFMGPDVDAVLHRASRKIAHLLGDVPSLSELKLRFGPGATVDITKRNAHPRYKLGDVFACSEDLVPVVSDVLSEVPGWVELLHPQASSVPCAVQNARVSFVPKNAKTDRAICVEPSLNTMCQLGIGDWIARKLESVGQSTRDQSRNQRLARVGSITDDLVTVDLQAASDSISIELVADLLPLDWFFFLSQFRSGTVECGGEVVRLEKFSSMGNGFTFPLETLIFWAIASSCVRPEDLGYCSVYGDDIIVPTYAYPLLYKALRACGFVVNTTKSFTDGPFRESCGKDYYLGIDVRPVFIKDALSCADVFRLHNFFYGRGYTDISSFLVSLVQDEVRLFGPPLYGDGHLHCSNYADFYRPYKRDFGYSGFLFDTYIYGTRKSFKPGPGDAVLPCYSVYAKASHEDSTRIAEARFQHRAPQISEASGVLWKGHRMGVVLPGTSGYKRISIYTLA